MAPQLFYASLEAHMKAYMEQVKLDQINIEYQAMENQIVQEGERMQLSQAEIQVKLDQAKKHLVDQAIKSLAAPSFSKTDVSPPNTSKSMARSIVNDIISKLPSSTFAAELEEKVKNPKLKKTTPHVKAERKPTPLELEIKAAVAKRSPTSSSQATTASTTSVTSPTGAAASIDFEKSVTQLRKEIRDQLSKKKIPETEWPGELVGKLKQGTTKARLNEIYSELMASNIVSGSGLKNARKGRRKGKKN